MIQTRVRGGISDLKGICEQPSELQPLGWVQAESPNFRSAKKLGKTLGIYIVTNKVSAQILGHNIILRIARIP